MHLGLVTIKNFRNIENLCVSFGAGLNVVVGENNIGKTNLTDAIRWALGIQSVGRDAAVYVEKGDRHRKADGSFVDAPIEVILEFRNLSAEERAEFLEILNYDETDPDKSTATIHCEWKYAENRDRSTYRRWGSNRKDTEGTVSDDVLQSLSVVFLEALRDAERELAPGRKSRLAKYLQVAATPEERDAIVKIGADSNRALKDVELVKRAEQAVAEVLSLASGTDLMRHAAIRPASTDFERLVQTLRVLLKPSAGADDDSLLDGLDTNGLGYNNLIFIATVLAELEARRDSPVRILLIEEPEAHLHPQLQTLLANHLASQAGKVQTLLTTHSPTIAAHVEPCHLAVMHRDGAGARRVTRVDGCGLSTLEERQLRRVLDVTKASLLFAQGVILVEGISECLLLPVLASRLGIDLAQKGVAVVPVGGVDFATIGRLFTRDKIAVPLSIVTDADPDVVCTGNGWREDTPKWDPMTERPVRSARAESVATSFAGQPGIRTEVSKLTLEYDLAAESLDNSLHMFDAWAACYLKKPTLLGREELEKLPSAGDRALLFWRAVCRASPQHGKASLAQSLALALHDRVATSSFVMPGYLARAIRHAARVPET